MGRGPCSTTSLPAISCHLRNRGEHSENKRQSSRRWTSCGGGCLRILIRPGTAHAHAPAHRHRISLPPTVAIRVSRPAFPKGRPIGITRWSPRGGAFRGLDEDLCDDGGTGVRTDGGSGGLEQLGLVQGPKPWGHRTGPGTPEGVAAPLLEALTTRSSLSGGSDDRGAADFPLFSTLRMEQDHGVRSTVAPSWSSYCLV